MFQIRINLKNHLVKKNSSINFKNFTLVFVSRIKNNTKINNKNKQRRRRSKVHLTIRLKLERKVEPGAHMLNTSRQDKRSAFFPALFENTKERRGRRIFHPPDILFIRFAVDKHVVLWEVLSFGGLNRPGPRVFILTFHLYAKTNV